MSKPQIPVGVSARHIHVTPEHLAILFGPGHELQKYKELSQPGQFASQETVDLVTEKSSFKKVRILGPVRKATQIELAMTDAMKLGIAAPVRDSGDTKGTPGLTVVGPKGEVKLTEGVIVAGRHIHMSPADAAQFGVKDKDIVKVQVGSDSRKLVFDQVLIRVSDSFKLDMHLDTDEANAAGCKTGDVATIVE